MTAADVRARIEAELARFKAEVAGSPGPEMESPESRRSRVEPLIRRGRAVEAEVRANVEAVRNSVSRRASTAHTVSQCPRFDRWLEGSEVAKSQTGHTCR